MFTNNNRGFGRNISLQGGLSNAIWWMFWSALAHPFSIQNISFGTDKTDCPQSQSHYFTAKILIAAIPYLYSHIIWIHWERFSWAFCNFAFSFSFGDVDFWNRFSIDAKNMTKNIPITNSTKKKIKTQYGFVFSTV